MYSLISKILFIFILTFAGMASAKEDIEFAVLAGLRSNTATTNLPNASVSSKLGYVAGILGWLPLNKGFGARSGLLFNQRFVGLGPTNQGDIDIQFTYLDIPLTGTYQIRNGTWLYAGPILAFNQSKDVACSRRSNCSATDVKSFVLPWQLGVDFKFTPNFGAEFFYEFMSGDLAASVSDMKAVGASFLIFL